MLNKGSIFVVYLFVCMRLVGQTQSFTGAGGAIPDDGAWHTYNCSVSSLNFPQINTSWGFEKVTINVNHTWDSDLEIHLISPDGTDVLLLSGVGGDGDNFTNTGFKNTYTTPIASGSAPFTGSFKPMGDLGLFNNGQAGSGVWQLRIRDSYPQDQGSVISWTIRFGSGPAVPYPVIHSNLPIIKINTNGQAIPDDPKIAAAFSIIDNGAGSLNYSNDSVFAYMGNIGIELRGSSSGAAPKPTYGFETWDTANNEIDTSLLGMPAESDWILSASYYDKTLMRNVLSYELFNRMGHYAARTRYCELFINGQYLGVYILMEKIKRDKNRVDIAKLESDDTTGNDVTGGYIIKIDKFTGSGGAGFYSNFPPQNPTGDAVYFQFEYPKETDIQPQQEDYIQRYVDSFETALFGTSYQDTGIGFRRFAGERTFMDDMLINEMSKNVDGYRLSSFFYKDKFSKGGKLKAGPVWDYDIAWGNANYCGGDDATGWGYEFGYVCSGAGMPAYWERMMSDTLFKKHLRCRWNTLRQSFLHLDSLFAFIDSTVAYIDSAQQRNFETWQILGVATWPQPAPIPQNYSEEIQRLKLGLILRFHWLDSAIYSFPVLSYYPVAGNDTSLCFGKSVQLNAGVYDSYIWSSGEAQQTIQPTQSGTYHVTVSDEFGCSGTDEVNVEFTPLPAVNLGNDTTVCEGTEVVLQAGNFASYLWNSGDTISSILVSQSGNYWVTVSDTLNCTATAQVQVTEQALPDATIGFTTSGNLYSFFTIDSVAENILWYFGDGDSSTAANPSHVYSSPFGDFVVTHVVTDSLGCTTTDSLRIFVTSYDLEREDDEVISVLPNPVNDMLRIYSSRGNISNLKIFDISGRSMLRQSVSASSSIIASVETLVPGVYILEINLESRVVTRRFVKQ